MGFVEERVARGNKPLLFCSSSGGSPVARGRDNAVRPCPAAKPGRASGSRGHGRADYTPPFSGYLRVKFPIAIPQLEARSTADDTLCRFSLTKKIYPRILTLSGAGCKPIPRVASPTRKGGLFYFRPSTFPKMAIALLIDRSMDGGYHLR
jgi:hypothetical protein